MGVGVGDVVMGGVDVGMACGMSDGYLGNVGVRFRGVYVHVWVGWEEEDGRSGLCICTCSLR